MRSALIMMQRHVHAQNLRRHLILHFTQNSMMAVWNAWRDNTQVWSFYSWNPHLRSYYQQQLH